MVMNFRKISRMRFRKIELEFEISSKAATAGIDKELCLKSYFLFPVVTLPMITSTKVCGVRILDILFNQMTDSFTCQEK